MTTRTNASTGAASAVPSRHHRIDYPAWDIRLAFRYRHGIVGAERRQAEAIAGNAKLQHLLRTNFGFVNETMAEAIALLLPDLVFLVRCGEGRALVYADTLAAMVQDVDSSPTDYVRDVAIWPATWKSEAA